jgi:archaellum component FlaF (FlaF/FlaG flagellin family)
VNYAADDTPYGVAIGDFNGDGNLDFASVGSTLMLFLGNGDGTFQPQISIPSTGGTSVAAGDFNGDGKLDLVFADYPNVSVVLGNGDGTFQSPITSPAGYDGHIRVADFNGDGILDIVAINFFTDFLDAGFSVQLGNGDGTFQAPVYYAAGVYPYNIFVGDFNGDGAPDLAIPSQTGITVELNTGGTFLSTTNAPNPSTLQQAVILTTTVTASLKGLPAPTGSVTFKDGGATLGTASVLNGQAMLTTSFTKPGTHTITAVYSGDSQFNPHTAASVTQTVLSPVVNLSPSSLNFGNQKVGTTSPPQTVKLTNRGQGTLNISSISLLGNSDFNFTNNCGSSVAPNKSCTISVTFTPQKTGTGSATISIGDNAANSPQKIPLTGNGT